MIYEIKSHYILKYIIDFIPDKKIKLILFSHSNYFRKRLDLNYLGCYEKYLDELGFDINKYLFEIESSYEKGKLSKEYSNFISTNRLNKEKFEKVLYEVLNNQEEDYKNLNIDSPLLEIVSKTKDFDKYAIYISQKNIDEYGLKDQYKIIFNKSNIKFSSINYVYNDETKLNYLKDLGIIFKNIRKIRLEYNGYDEIIEESHNSNSNIIINTLNLFPNINQFVLRDNKNIIKFLESVIFNNLKELDLSNNKISDIKVLEKLKFDKLEKLDLSSNKISEISALENANFKELKELNLSWNKISDIKVLKCVKFHYLEKLDLSMNEISDISILENVNFKKLKELDLSDNKISDIKVLDKIKFNELEKIDFSYNKISDISKLGNIYFKKLKELDLSGNHISEVVKIKKENCGKLEKLDLSYNKIKNIERLKSLKNVRFELGKNKFIPQYNF